MKFSDRYHYTVLCEDQQTSDFICHILKRHGVNDRKIRIETAASGIGSGEAYVRREYPKQLRAMRTFNYNRRALIVCTDADRYAVQERKDMLKIACEKTDPAVPHRKTEESVLLWVPKRNIETWIRFFALKGNDTDETTDYKTPQRRPSKNEAYEMSDYLEGVTEWDNILPSLQDAKEEYDRVVTTLK